jgi:hypothetical protein
MLVLGDGKMTRGGGCVKAERGVDAEVLRC